MAQYRFVKTGNFVDFYDQAMHVIKLHDTSRCITWTFDDTVGVNFKIDEMIYHSDLMSEISFDGVACTSHADFKAGILAMFPDMAGGDGGGTTPGIDDVLAVNQGLTQAGHIYTGAGNHGLFLGDSVGVRAQIDISPAISTIEISTINQDVGDNRSWMSVQSSESSTDFLINANFNDSPKLVTISGSATETSALMQFRAFVQEFFAEGDKVLSITAPEIIIGKSGFPLISHVANLHKIEGDILLLTTTVPGASNATGSTGQISWDSSFIYMCVAPDEWKRVAIATW